MHTPLRYQIYATHSISCLQPIRLQTLVAIGSESCQTLFPSFYASPSEVAVLYNLNLSRSPFLGKIVDLDLLLCTGFDANMLLCSHITFLLTTKFGQMNEQWALLWSPNRWILVA